MIHGIHRIRFAELIEKTFKVTRLSYREAGEDLGIVPSTFTRIRNQEAVNMDSLIILVDWIHVHLNLSYDTIISQIILKT